MMRVRANMLNRCPQLAGVSLTDRGKRVMLSLPPREHGSWTQVASLEFELTIYRR